MWPNVILQLTADVFQLFIKLWDGISEKNAQNTTLDTTINTNTSNPKTDPTPIHTKFLEKITYLLSYFEKNGRPHLKS